MKFIWQKRKLKAEYYNEEYDNSPDEKKEAIDEKVNRVIYQTQC
jgi:hypothetical protein